MSIPKVSLPSGNPAMSDNPPPDSTNNENALDNGGTSRMDAAIKNKFPKIVHFTDLAVCGEEIWIENNGELYRLQRTKQGKLILTK